MLTINSMIRNDEFMKKLPALIAALIITATIALVMGGVGISAYASAKQNAASTQSALSTQVAVSVPTTTTSSSGTTNQSELDAYAAQLNQAVQQINTANAQIQSLQSQLSQANQQISNDNSTLQTYQNILLQLEQRGLITISSDGTITIRGRNG